MASRDKSQGFAFIYVDIKKLLRETSKAIREEDPVLIKDTRHIPSFVVASKVDDMLQDMPEEISIPPKGRKK